MSRKILVVDDESHIRRLVETYLKRNGFEVVTASTGAEALCVMERVAPDAVVLDIVMPASIMDGLAVLKVIKDSPVHQGVPVIILTGQKCVTADKQRGMDAGAYAYLFKPFNPIELLVTVQEALSA